MLDSIPDQIALPVLIGARPGGRGDLRRCTRWRTSCRSPSTTTAYACSGGDADRRCDRSAVAEVFLDGKDLVLLGPDSNELAREKTDQSATRLADAFTRHGYPWRTER